MGCKFVQRCCYKWLSWNCIGLDVANLMIYVFQKMAEKNSLQITKSSCFFPLSEKHRWPKNKMKMGREMTPRRRGRNLWAGGIFTLCLLRLLTPAFCAVGSKAFAFMCAGRAREREREREGARERSCSRSLWGWCVSVKGAGDDPSGDGSTRKGGATVVVLKSSSMGLVEAAAARGSRVILHFCCFVRDYGVFLRR